ncbi:hypothetical protein Tco_1548849 [Tanacetum coccineum]
MMMMKTLQLDQTRVKRQRGEELRSQSLPRSNPPPRKPLKVKLPSKGATGKLSVSVKKLHGYGHLEEIMVKRAGHQFYKFKEGDSIDLHLNDIEDMLLLAVQHKLFHLTDSR